MAAVRSPNSREEFRESRCTGYGTFGGRPLGVAADVSNDNLVVVEDEFGYMSYASGEASDHEANHRI